MTVTAYPRNTSPGMAPGTWSPIPRTGKARTAFFRCPSCQNIAPLEHEIAADGAVTPPVVCPYEGCEFHEFIRLEGWQN